MSEGELLKAGPICSGDLVYFSCTSDTGEELTWTTSMTEQLRLLPKAEIHDPSMCLFQLDGPSEPGSLIRPLDSIALKQLLSNRYVDYEPNQLIFLAKMGDEKRIDMRKHTKQLVISVIYDRVGATEVIQENDAISLIVQSGDSQFQLSRDFSFRGVCTDTFRIHKYDSATKEKAVRYGQVCKLRAGNNMHLSVRPNFENSDIPLILDEDKQSANYEVHKEELCFPEYIGHLKADLTSDAENANNLWMIEREDRFRGGEVELSDFFYLKHLASGRYLKGDLTLQQRDSAKMFQLQSAQQTEGPLGYGEFKYLRSGNTEVSQDYTQSLSSVQTQLFEYSFSDFNQNTVLRVCLTEKPATDPKQKLMFSVTQVTFQHAALAIYFSQLRSILPAIRLVFQNLPKLEDGYERVNVLTGSFDGNDLLIKSPAESFKGSLFSDFQIVNEIFRLQILKKRYTNRDDKVRNIGFLKSISTFSHGFGKIEKVIKNIFANKALMLGLISANPRALLRMASFPSISFLLSKSTRVYWAEVILSLHFNEPKMDQAGITLCEILLNGLNAKLICSNAGILKRRGLFPQISYRPDGLINIHTDTDDSFQAKPSDEAHYYIEKIIKMAAILCSMPDLTEDPIPGMGLTLDNTLALHDVARKDFKLHMAFLHFITQVYVPTVNGSIVLSSITEKRIVKFDSLIFPQVERLNWLYFVDPNSPISQLVKNEVYFWLSTVHTVENRDDGSYWYQSLYLRLGFMKQLIEYGQVSDLFVASMVSSAIAMTWYIAASATGDYKVGKMSGFMERFPDASKNQSGSDASDLVKEMFALLGTYQRWKTVRVMEKCKHDQVKEVTRDVIEKYLKELDFREILKDFCSLNSISLNSDKERLLSDDPAGIPTLVKNLDILLRNEDLTPENFLIYLLMNTPFTYLGDPSQHLDLIDREIDMPGALLEQFSNLVDETPYQAYLPYVEAIRNVYPSPYQLETTTEVVGLTEYISELESLADFMRGLKRKENLANFQSFLERADFFVELERMWSYSIHIGPQFARESNSEKLRSLTFELSLYYVQDNEPHRAALLQIMTESDFYPEYSEYLRLLMELRVLKAKGKIAANLIQTILQSTRNRALPATKALLGNAEMKSQTIFAVLDYLKEKEALSDYEWELLTTVMKYLPLNIRLGCVAKVIDKWSSATSSTWKDGALLIIYADNRNHEVFVRSYTAIGNYLAYINTMEVQSILKHFSPKRNTDNLNKEMRYVLELLFEEEIGVAYQIGHWSHNLPLTNFFLGLGNFSKKMGEVLDLTALKSILGLGPRSVRKTTEESEINALSSLPGEPSIPPPSFIFSIQKEASPVRPLYRSILKKEYISDFTFNKLKEVFLPKKLELDYLYLCNEAASRIYRHYCTPKEMIQVLEQLADMVINHKNVQAKELSLEVMVKIVSKLSDVIPLLLQELGVRRLYLRFFGVLEEFIVRYLGLMRRMNQESNPMIEKQLKSTAKVIQPFLEIWQWCCDGCNKDFQNYLRSQGEGADINLISLIASLMSELLKDFTSSISSLVSQCCKTLLEALSGPCVENQKTVIETPGFLESVQSVIDKITLESQEEDHFLVLNSLVGLLKSLTEGRERNKEAMKPLTDKIIFDKFQEISSAYEKILTEADLKALSLNLCKDEVVKRKFNFAVECLILFFSSAEIAETSINSRLLKFLGFVEIQHQDGAEEPQIRSLTFQVPFHAHYLTDRSATQLLFEIDRDSRQEKLDDFTTKVRVCEVEMLHQQRLSQLSLVKGITKHWKLYWYISYCFILAINFMLLLTVEAVHDQRMNIPPEEELFVLLFSIIQVCFIILGTVSYYIEYVYILKRPLQKRQESKEMEILPSLPNPGSLEQSKVTPKADSQLPLNTDQVVTALARLGYALLACVASVYPALYPFLLLQILNFNDAVLNIFKSVTLRGSQLILTLIFSLMIIYMFTFIAYLFFYGYYNTEGGLYCDTLLACFLSTLNLGMRSGGGIGDAYGPTSETDFNSRLIFDLLFYITITTVLMAIVFGIIVDTFSELRDDHNAIESDMNNVCFICGQKRSVIEVRGEGWVVHTTMVHNPFAYMYFLLHLQETYEKDCSGIEKEVKQNYQELKLSFYPTTSLAIGFRDEED